MAMIDPVKVEIEILHEWQLCPKCNGEGKIMNDIDNYIVSTIPTKPCDVCNGKKIISKVTGNPPE